LLQVAGMSRAHKPEADYATKSETQTPVQISTNKSVVQQKSVTTKPPVAKAVTTNSVELADAVEKEYEKLMEDDDAAQAEVDQWIQDNEKFATQGAGLSQPEMKRKITARFEPIKQAYEDFLRRHPNHAKARIAYGSFWRLE